MEAVQNIIRKSVIDRAFAKKLMRNTDEAVKGFDLTQDEIAAIKAMQIDFEQKFNGFADERKEAQRKKKREVRIERD
jgi:hypothetical protein